MELLPLLVELCTFLAFFCSLTWAKQYHQANNSYHFTIMERVNTASQLTCMAFCDQTPECHTIIWNGTNPQCILVGNTGSTLLSSFNGSQEFYSSSLIDVVIIPGSEMGVSNDSHPELAFHADPTTYYKSTFQSSMVGITSGFAITFSRSAIVTKVQLVYANETTSTSMHWHMNYGYPYCDPELAGPQAKGITLNYLCGANPAVSSLSLHLSFQGYVAFNNLKIFGTNNVVLFP